MKKSQLSRLASLVDGRNISRLQINTSEFKMSVSRKGKIDNIQASSAPNLTNSVSMHNLGKSSDIHGKDDNRDELIIKADRVGIFYSTDISDTIDTIHPGDSIVKGQPLCMIDSMGVEHVIKAPFNSVLASIFAKDTQPVQYGEPLFKLLISNNQNNSGHSDNSGHMDNSGRQNKSGLQGE
jgi:acetyl-CoA carboxylase biotin carboxyl carrier protein